MLPQSIAVFISKARAIFAYGKKAAEITAKVIAGAEMIRELTSGHSADFNLRIPHSGKDSITVMYLSLLLWTELARKASSSESVSSQAISALFVDYFLPEMKHYKMLMNSLPSDASASQVSEILTRWNVHVYVKRKAPQWDGILESYLTSATAHPIAEAYVNMHHSSVLASPEWKLALIELDSEITHNLIQAHLSKFLALSNDEAGNKVIMAYLASQRIGWSSYVVTAMYYGSVRQTAPHEPDMRERVQGQVFLNTVPLAYAAPSSYAQMVSSYPARTAQPSVVLKRPSQIAADKAARAEEKLNEGTESQDQND